MKNALNIFAVVLTLFFLTSTQAEAAVEEVGTARMLAVVNSTDAVVIEFYDSKASDQSGECANDVPIFQSVADEYAGKVTFLRFDIQQDMALAEAGRLTVCPTHLFVFHQVPDPQAIPNRTTYRRMGFLSAAQFKELIALYFSIQAP